MIFLWTSSQQNLTIPQDFDMEFLWTSSQQNLAIPQDFDMKFLWTSSQQNLAIPQDFYTKLSISMERSCWQCVGCYGAGGFYEQSQCFFVDLSCSLTYGEPLFSLSLNSSMHWNCGVGVFVLIECIHSLPTSWWRFFKIIIIIIIDM